MNMEKQFLNTIRKYNMINSGDTIIVGLSGGCDSVALFILLNKHKQQLNINIEAVHVNHLIREDSFDDENFCINLCKKYNVKLHVYNKDINAFAKEQKLSSEEAGRIFRYDAFNKHAKNSTYKIAIAHNKNDVAETLLMRLFRGSGLQGLKSISPTRQNIIRPIIEIERCKLESYLSSINQYYCTDSTNLLPIYNRNKVRLAVLPYIKEHFNKNIINTLYNTSKIIEEEQDFLQSIVLQKYNLLTTYKNKVLTVDLPALKQEHTFLQKQIIIKAVSNFVPNNKNISQKHINSIINLVNSNDGQKTINLPNDLILIKNYEKLILKINTKSNIVLQEQTLVLDNIIYLPTINKYIYATICTNNDNFDTSKICNKSDLKLTVVKRADFCYYKVYNYVNIKIRTRKIGDKIVIQNVGTKKLKNYFIDKKINKDIRDEIPLLTIDNQVLWIFDNFNTINSNYLNTTDKIISIFLMEA